MAEKTLGSLKNLPTNVKCTLSRALLTKKLGKIAEASYDTLFMRNDIIRQRVF